MRIVCLTAMVSLSVVDGGGPARATDPADEIHYSFTGPSSVTFDWRGGANAISYGLTTAYDGTVVAHTPSPVPISSPGPFWEADLTNLAAGTTYHYAIGGGPDHVFTTAPTGDYRFDVMADVGSSLLTPLVTTTQQQITSDNPAFVLLPGDITYANPNGQAHADQHFNDVMTWSQTAAYMPVWGNHEWDAAANDDLRNYKGRFAMPNPQAALGAPAEGGSGEDWGWFDAGPVRFISYPDRYATGTWSDWKNKVAPIMAAAQADPAIRFIVTFGHRPAYSTGYHPGESSLAPVFDALGEQYPKLVLNLNGHSHDYERFQPIHNITHITSGGGSALEVPWSSVDPRTVVRAMRLNHLRIDVTATNLHIEAVCGPATARDDTNCVQGSVLDSVDIGTGGSSTAAPRQTTFYVDKNNPSCTDAGPATPERPLCTIGGAAVQAVYPGQTVVVATGTYNESVVVQGSGSASSPLVFTAAPGANVTVTGRSQGFTVTGRSWVVIRGFTVTATSREGIIASSSSNLTLTGNTVSYAGQPATGLISKGIRLSGVTDSLVAGNSVHHNTDSGIYLVSGSSRVQVTDNVIYSNARVINRAAAGIEVASPGNTISSNVTRDNEDSGIEFTKGANNNLVTNNVTYGNGDHGIDVLNATGERLVANTVYNNSTAGINLEGGSTAGLVANNISVDNGLGGRATVGNIRVDSTSTTGTTVDFDLVFLRSGVVGTELVWGSKSYPTLDSFTRAVGQEANGIQADPRWAAPGAGDFHLTAGSVAIDAADSGASGQPAADRSSTLRRDDPATVNRGVGPRPFDDRGALEFLPEAPPFVAFDVTPSSGVGPLAVSVDAGESYDDDATPIVSFSFDFGDGSVAGPQSGATTSHTYTAAGTRVLKVTVTDAGGTSSSASTQIRVIDLPPTVGLAVSPSSGNAPLVVTADASASTDTDSTPIASYAFDFGDGTTRAAGPDATASHTYRGVGTYTVTATVTDTAGQASSASRQVVTSDAPPVAALSVTPASGRSPMAVTASAAASTDTDSTPIAAYTFDFGDGTVVGPQSASTAAHTYLSAGVHTARVTVADTAGLTSSATADVTVSDGPPDAVLALTPSTGHAPLTVKADAGGSTDPDATPIASYQFDFGDGTVVGPQAGSVASHVYAAAGTYTATVQVTDTAGLTGRASSQVSVDPANRPPSAVLTVTPASGTAPLPVTADASASSDPDATPIATYQFDFGDGAVVGPQAGSSATHTYVRAGSYTVTLVVTDPSGASSTSTSQVTVQDLPPRAALTVTPSSGLVALTVKADGSDSTDADVSPIASYRFDFGDGVVVGPQAGSSASHVYRTPGSYTVTETVTDTAGLSSTASAAVNVSDAPPSADLVLTPSAGTVGVKVTADASRSVDADATPIDSYRFDFGDGTTVGPQTGSTASHTYTTPGTHKVTVTVTDTAGLASTASAEAAITDQPPSAALGVSPSSGVVALSVTADASPSSDNDATPIASYTFDFGDGPVVGPQPGPVASHTYATAGNRTVTVTVTDTAGNSSSTTAAVRVTDLPPTAALAVSPSSGRAALAVTADASGSSDTDGTPIASYSFDFGDGTIVGPQAGAVAAHTYSVVGTYTVAVSVTDTGGFSSVTKAVVIVNPVVGNPGFESGTEGWSPYPSTSVALARVAGGHSGGWSARLSNIGTASTSCTLNDSPNWVTRTIAATYTGSLWVRADTAGAVFKLRFREYDTSSVNVGSQTSSLTLSTTWQLVTVAYRPISPGSTLDLNGYSTSNPGVCFYADDVGVTLS